MGFIREAIRQGMSRRTFLRGAGALAAAPFLTGWCEKALAAVSPGDLTRPGAGNFNTRLVLLGTAGGPVWYPESNRVGTSTALVVGDTIYLVDLGHGATHRMAEAFNSGIFVNTPGGKVEKSHASFLRNADALFFTHLHMDHTADYPTLLLIGQSSGLGNVKVPGQPAQPLIEHLNLVHTKISEVGGVAEDCGVGTLVLNHIVPGNAPVGHLMRAKRNFSGELIIGEDLMKIGIGKAGSGKSGASAV